MGNINGRPSGKAPKPEVIQRELRSVKLRQEGLTWAEIAVEVGYKHPGTARDAYMRSLHRVIAEDVDELRQLESDRLDALQVAHWEKALEGDLKSGELVVKIIAARCKLLGLDRKPVTTSSFTGNPPWTGTESDVAEIERILARISELDWSDDEEAP